MNRISWIIYLSDIFPNIQTFIILATIFWSAFVLFKLAVLMPSSEARVIESIRMERRTRAKRFFYLNFTVVLCLFFISSLIPSRPTLLMIAASEASEKVLTSEQGTSILNTLTKVLKEKAEN